ncbi:MAG: serine hydrolase, partial [Oscillospiraceae bacterium]|nr:serine hydrolase [Oscillospiraceae bacterium]
ETFFETLREKIEHALEMWGCPSVGLGVIYQDEVLFCDGIGLRNREKNLPATGQTLYQIGSCSKAFTSAICAKLVDDGKLSWDTPIRDIAPEVQFFDPFTSQNVTLRDVLSHRTGVPRHEYSWYGTNFDRKELVEHVKYLEPNQPFRTMFQYNNYGYVIAGHLIEKVTGKSFEENVQEIIFDPLGMTRSTLFLDDMEADEDHATPYGNPGESFSGAKEVPFYRTEVEDKSKGIGAPFAAAGAINSSAEEMLKWVKFHLAGGDEAGKWEGKQILSKESFNELHKPSMIIKNRLDMPQDETDFSTYGLAWFIENYRGHKIIHHGGSINGFSAMTFMVPEIKLGVVAYTNMDGCQLHMSICKTVADHFLGLSEANWFQRYFDYVRERMNEQKNICVQLAGEKVEGTHPSHSLEDYVGEYSRPGYGYCAVSLKDGKLILHFLGVEDTLEHYHYDTFVSADVVGEVPPGMPVHFHSAEVGGKIDEVRMPLVLEEGGELIRFKKVID